MRWMFALVWIAAGCAEGGLAVVDGADAMLRDGSEDCEWVCWTANGNRQCEWCCDDICTSGLVADDDVNDEIDALGGGGLDACTTTCDGQGHCETCCDNADGSLDCQETGN